MSGGAEFQARVAARLSVNMLGEEEAPTLFDRPGVIVWIGVEAAGDVDDIVVAFSDGGLVYIQCKRTVNLAQPAKPGKKQVPLGSAIDQFVRQYHAGVSYGGAPPRPLALDRERLVLAVGNETFVPIRVTLRKLLDRLYSHPAGQPVTGVARNADERRVLAVLLEHVRRGWRTATQRAGTDAEVLEFLRFVRVVEFTVEAGQEGELAAEQILRSSVLADPAQARLAWDRLFKFWLESQSRQRSTDRAGVVRLLHPDIRVKAARSYQADVERLRAHSRRVAEQLMKFGSISIAGAEVGLERAYATCVRAAAEAGHLLLTGKPGVGKSGVQQRLFTDLEIEGRDVVVLAAQDYSASSLVALRTELELEHDVAEILSNWPGEERAFLLIDALDAARGEPAARALRQLIRDVARRAERWRVVASIREYDLQYGVELRQLFAGQLPASTPLPPLPDGRLRHVRHIVVGDFSEEELAGLESVHTGLHGLVTSAPPELRKLIANPFNLNLAASLISTGRSPDSIRSITTQMELLDEYWSARVEEGGSPAQRFARFAVLRNVAEEMIRVRALRAAQANVIGTADSAALDELLQANVLAGWQRRPDQAPEDSTLVFAHHRIFDYAVERTVLRGTSIGARLAADPQLVLFARPSVEMHFEHLWEVSGHERADFWAEVLDVCGRPGVRGIDALVGPGVAARRARTPDDMAALVVALSGPNSGLPSAERAVEYTLRSLLPGAGLDVILVGTGAGPWAKFLEQVSRVRMVPVQVLWAVGLVLGVFARQKAGATPEQMTALGAASRRLLERAWSAEPRNGGFVRLSMETVLEFFGSSPAESSRLLRRALAPDHLARYGYEELRHFDNYVPELAELDPEFTRDLYASAFALEPPPKTPTSFGGVIMPFSSNAAQDLGVALYGLTRRFPAFLQRAPVFAAAALVPVARFHGEHAEANRSELAGRFDFHGVEARVTADYKELWRHTRNADEAAKLFQQLETYLVTLGADSTGEHTWRTVVDHLVRENDRASLWAVLLRAGARVPDSLGEYLKPLLWTTRLLGGIDTKGSAGEFLTAMAPRLDGAERERVERAILAIDEPDYSDLGFPPGRLRAGLLRRLGEGDQITPEARVFLDKWRAGGSPSETEAYPPVVMSRRGESEEERLARMGVLADDEANHRIREFTERAEHLADLFRNGRVRAEKASSEVTAILVALEASLATAEADGVHPELRTDAYAAFVTLCAQVTAERSFSCAGEIGALVRTAMLHASRDPRPETDPDVTQVVKDWPMLLSGGPRGSAAIGLSSLAGEASCTGSDVVEALDRLALDPVDEVRVHVARGVAVVAKSEEEVAWRIAERMAREEPVPGVVAALMMSLRYMIALNADRVAELAVTAHSRLAVLSEAPESRWQCVQVLTRLYLVYGHSGAWEYLLTLLDRPGEYVAEASHLISVFQDGLLTRGDVEHHEPVDDQLRKRSFDILTRLAKGASHALSTILSEEVSEENRESWRERASAISNLVDGVGRQVYFATGRDGDELKPSAEQLARFYRESAELIDILSGVGLPSLTHHLVETLEVFIPADPREVFLKIARAIRSGAREGYHYDSMAEDLFIRVVEEYLADHPQVFQQFEDCRTELLDLLDLFVRVGSTSAMRLTYGLRELFL